MGGRWGEEEEGRWGEEVGRGIRMNHGAFPWGAFHVLCYSIDVVQGVEQGVGLELGLQSVGGGEQRRA